MGKKNNIYTFKNSFIFINLKLLLLSYVKYQMVLIAKQNLGPLIQERQGTEKEKGFGEDEGSQSQ
jgi:hypothetical protein